MFESLAALSAAAVLQIVAIDILLGGDNAVVIALACRKLPPEQRRLGILWGTAGAIALRVVLVVFALGLLRIPGLKLVGAALLLWIGVGLLLAETHEGHGDITASTRLWGAVKTVIVADFVMSLDNVVAIAGAAETAAPGHQMALVIFGLALSVPIIVWGSQFVIRLMERWPVIVTAGGMLLGWIAGTMAVSDPVLQGVLPPRAASDGAAQATLAMPSGTWVHYGVGVAGALLVLALGSVLARRAAGLRERRTAAQRRRSDASSVPRR